VDYGIDKLKEKNIWMWKQRKKKTKEKRNTRWMHYANNGSQPFIAAKVQY
jgi:hypothetical protein